MNVLFMHTASSRLFSSVWVIALLSGCLGELRPALHINQTVLSISDNNSSAQLRQYTCGTTTTVYVSKGYQGRFASPNYPSLYSGGADCLWTLTTSTDSQFTLICDPLSISCTGDYLLFSPSGDTAFRDSANPICGSGRLQVTSKANSIAIAFHSSYYTNGGGFSCVAQAQAPPTTSTIAPTPNCQCGIKGQNRVVGGQSAGVTEWPWQTLMADISPSGGGNQFCGATLISPNWVLTAAHCTHNRMAANIGVVVGQYDTKSLSSTSQVRRVSQIVQHPNFNRTTVNHDIALLKLDSPVSFTAAVRPVCLPTRFVNYNFDKQIGTVTGWGTTSFGGTASPNLLEVALPIISTENCRLNSIVGSKITDNMFCTYAENKDACQGDSGGPLNWIDPQTGLGYIVGITSFGIGCAKLNTPGIYTKVTNYLSWIQQNTGTICSV
ncbi:chymotrypsinogen A-like [Daphnia pulicaria]|uniref:chymotrypsinogen A-like n=1 Tax=Daphnia pulicaria TaxID=35523 RepID=UPI001EEB9A04|nr:chymotrypsinogen A-like [Daphnia pulicaria]